MAALTAFGGRKPAVGGLSPLDGLGLSLEVSADRLNTYCGWPIGQHRVELDRRTVLTTQSPLLMGWPSP
jgi:hypothetical protein